MAMGRFKLLTASVVAAFSCVSHCEVTKTTDLGVSQSSDALEQAQPSVTLATGKGYAPFVDFDMPEGGWSTSLIKHTFDKLSLGVNIEVLPWNRALKWTSEGKFLASFPFVYSERREQQFLFSTPINFVPVHMYVAKNSGFSGPEDLRGKRLCFPLSYSLDSLEQGLVDKFEMTINRVKDGIGCFKHVQKGWSDAGLTNGYIHPDKLALDNNQDNPIIVFTQQLALIPLHLIISKDYPDAEKWLHEFNHAFSQLDKSGEKSHIDGEYLELIRFL